MNGIAATQFLALSTPTAVSWLAYIIIGGIAGWLASKIVRGGGSGILVDIVVGVVGGYIGGTLLGWLGRRRRAWAPVVYLLHRAARCGHSAIRRAAAAWRRQTLTRCSRSD